MDIRKIRESLQKDGIIIKEPNQDIMDYLTSITNRDLVKRIYANRYDTVDDVKEYLNTSLSNYLNRKYISKLPDMDKAYKFIKEAMDNNQRILLVTDYDVDGVTSATIGYYMFKDLLEYDNVEIIVNKREYGNGINNIMKDIILSIYEDRPFQLFMTSDHGSSNRDNLEEIYTKTNAKMVITDHHLYRDEHVPLGSKIIGDDLAFINPQRPDATISKNITGTTVLYLTLLYAYMELSNNNISKDKWDIIYYLITYVGMTVISDCMDLKDPFNRRLVIKALKLLNSKHIQHNPFWLTIKRRIESSYFIDETTLGFEVIPMLNTPGRIDDPTLSFKFMTVNNEDDADIYLEKILALNKQRKDRQDEVLSKDDHIIFKTDDILVMLADNSKDLQGIIANRMLYNHNYKLAIVFAESDNDDLLIGSVRANDNKINVVKLFEYMKTKTDLIVMFGGHGNAAGIKIKHNLEEFFNILKTSVNELYELTTIEQLEVDEYIYSNKKLLISMIDVKDAGPYGIGYSKPLFVSDVYIDSYRIIKKASNSYLTGRVKLSNLSDFKIGFFYTIKRDEFDDINDNIKYCKHMRIAYTLGVNSYFNYNKVSLNVEWLKLYNNDPRDV